MKILLLLLIFNSAVAGTKSLCLKQGLDKLVNESDPSTYKVFHPTEDGVLAVAQIGRDDNLEIYIHAVSDAGNRVPGFSGKDQYKKMLKHFSGKFKGIKAIWTHGDNLAHINKFTAPPHSYSLGLAVRGTWSYQRALEAGHSKLKVIEAIKDTSGTYSKVVVVFERP